jgi:predicted Zn-dependent protease
VYAQYLTALVRSNQAARAEELVARWLREALIDGELPEPAAGRLRAAVNFALGQGYNLASHRVEERWFAPLAEVARFFSRRDDFAAPISSIFQASRFASSDVGRALRKELTERLVKEIDTLPLARVEYLMGWVWSHDGMEKEAWKTVAAALRKRYDAEKDDDTKHRLGEQLARVLSWLDDDAWLAFFRARLAAAPDAYRTHYAHRLFEVLTGRPWAPAIEDELFALLPKLAGPDEPADGLAARVAALYRLTDLMVERRYEARMKGVERPETLTRTELQKKQGEARKAAREGFADRLRKEDAKQPGPFAQWLTAERVWLDVTLDRDLKAAADDAWAVLTAPEPKANPDDVNAAVAARLDELLRARALAVLQNLAARKGANPALVDRLVKFVDAQIAAHPDAPRWRGEKYKLLIALDRPKELEAELVRWTGAPDADSRWRLALGYLFAEQGKVADAIGQFERVEAADELTPPAYRALAEWYLVEDRRAEHERAKVSAYKTAGEHELSNRLNAYLSPWRSTSGPLPTTFDPEVLNVFRALFEKSSSPQNYLGPLGQFYGASRDFRLLSMLPDAVIGHTAAKVYPFLAGMGGVLAEVRDEATADQIVKRIGEGRPAAKTPVDQRALDLLEVLVERRAADLQNQPGPHAAKALAALERAAKREWAPGEPRLMADFLAGLGAVPQPALAKEQLRQLEGLHRASAAGTYDRLHIAHRYAEALNAHSGRADAIDLLQAALKEFEEANGGTLPTSAHSAVLTLVALHASAGQYDRGERFLLDHLARPAHADQKRWLARRLTDLYHEALTRKARVSLGEGAALYKALETRLFAELNDPDQNHRYATFGQLTRLYYAARDLKLAGVADDVKAFAFTRLPKPIAEQTINYESVVRDVAEAVAAVVGPRDAIAFLLDRADAEPDWRRYVNEDIWSQHNYRIGQWRLEAKELGGLEPRLLAFVVKELKRDLRDRQSRGRAVYDRRNSYFWEGKADAFAAAAEEVLAGQKGSGAASEFVAEYLFFGLARERRAIEVLSAAHGQKKLGESGRSQLADYLHRTSRHAEAIPILAALVAERPDEITYRTRLMHAYFRTGRRDELLALLKATDAYFHEKDRWTEGVLAALANSTRENSLFAQSVAYFEELIPRHQRAAGGRVANDSTLSGYYGNAARAYAGLGKTKEAVDMASGAIVTWGPHSEQRKEALKSLVEVLTRAADLEKYVEWLKEQPLQSAVVRKALGKAYLARNDHVRARPHLEQAAQLQPGDAETYELLLECCEKTGDPLAAVDVLLAAVKVSRRDAKLFERLGRQYAGLGRAADAERAHTSIVEMLPNESEGHAALAEVREKQGRWADAIAHWERVSELRALEPTGLVKLAAAQIEGKEYGPAAETLRKLRNRTWPPRFTDVEKQTRDLERKLEERSKK